MVHPFWCAACMGGVLVGTWRQLYRRLQPFPTMLISYSEGFVCKDGIGGGRPGVGAELGEHKG
jgi:hypothetical protein